MKFNSSPLVLLIIAALVLSGCGYNPNPVEIEETYADLIGWSRSAVIERFGEPYDNTTLTGNGEILYYVSRDKVFAYVLSLRDATVKRVVYTDGKESQRLDVDKVFAVYSDGLKWNEEMIGLSDDRNPGLSTTSDEKKLYSVRSDGKRHIANRDGVLYVWGEDIHY